MATETPAFRTLFTGTMLAASAPVPQGIVTGAAVGVVFRNLTPYWMAVCGTYQTGTTAAALSDLLFWVDPWSEVQQPLAALGEAWVIPVPSMGTVPSTVPQLAQNQRLEYLLHYSGTWTPRVQAFLPTTQMVQQDPESGVLTPFTGVIDITGSTVDVGTLSGAVTLAAGTTVDVGNAISLQSGTVVAVAPGATVDVGAVSGAITLASGATVDIGNAVSLQTGTVVALAAGATVDVGTISGAITLASGATVDLAAGTTVDVGTITGAVTLASGATVDLAAGTTVDVGTITGAVTLASGTTVELAAGATVDVGTISGAVSLAAGTTVDVGTITGAITLASGATVDIGNAVSLQSGTVVAVAPGATVGVSSVSAPIALASGTVIEVSGGTVDVGTISGNVNTAVINEQLAVGQGRSAVATTSIPAAPSPVAALVTLTLAPYPNNVSVGQVGINLVSAAGLPYLVNFSTYLSTPSGSIETYTESTQTSVASGQTGYGTNGLLLTTLPNVVMATEVIVGVTQNDASQTADTLTVTVAVVGGAVPDLSTHLAPVSDTPIFALPPGSGALGEPDNYMMNGVPLPVQAYQYRPDLPGYLNGGTYTWQVVYNALPTTDYGTVAVPPVAGRNLLVTYYNGTNEIVNLAVLYNGARWQYPVANGGQSSNFYLNPGGGAAGLVIMVPNAPGMAFQWNWSTQPSTGRIEIQVCGIDGGW